MHHDLLRLFRIETQFHAAFYRRADITQGESDAAGSQFADEDMIDKVVKQIDKRVDILKAYYNTDEDLVYQEIALYKLSTELFIKMGTVEGLIRKYNARILEMNETCVVLEKSGHYDETQALFNELSETIGVLQFIRSGRVAITKSKVERLSDMLADMERKLQEKQQ